MCSAALSYVMQIKYSYTFYFKTFDLENTNPSTNWKGVFIIGAKFLISVGSLLINRDHEIFRKLQYEDYHY